MTIQRNIDAREQMTRKIGGKPTVKSLSAYEAEQALFGIAYKQPGMPTTQDCEDVFKRIVLELGDIYGNAVLSRFGIWKVRDLFMGLQKDFFLYCQSILVYGANPFYGWNLDAVTDRVRSRWLMWHPESECLFVINEPPKQSDFEEGCSDVTGIVEWEHRYQKQCGESGPEDDL